MVGKGFEETSKALQQAIPKDHLRFLAFLELSISLGDYFLCHAGVRPSIALEKQSAEDLLWIRDEFLNSKKNLGKLVGHGHTPTEAPEVLSASS